MFSFDSVCSLICATSTVFQLIVLFTSLGTGIVFSTQTSKTSFRPLSISSQQPCLSFYSTSGSFLSHTVHFYILSLPYHASIPIPRILFETYRHESIQKMAKVHEEAFNISSSTFLKSQLQFLHLQDSHFPAILHQILSILDQRLPFPNLRLLHSLNICADKLRHLLLSSYE